MIRRPPRSTPLYSSAASDVYKRQQKCPDRFHSNPPSSRRLSGGVHGWGDLERPVSAPAIRRTSTNWLCITVSNGTGSGVAHAVSQRMQRPLGGSTLSSRAITSSAPPLQATQRNSCLALIALRFSSATSTPKPLGATLPPTARSRQLVSGLRPSRVQYANCTS